MNTELANHKIKINCGICRQEITIKVLQIANEENFPCPRCGGLITLFDENGRFKAAIEEKHFLQKFNLN